MALFGEKYGERVRVVSVGDWARELCGGTHMRRTGELGVVKLLGESSIAAGVRRVEALVGVDAYRFLAREHLLVGQLSEILKARPEELPERIDAVLQRLKDAEREIDRARATQVLAQAAELAARRTEVDGVGLVAELLPAGVRPGDARTLALDIRGRAQAAGPSVVVLAAPGDGGQLSLVVASDAAAAARGAGAGGIMTVLAGALAGKGGGRDDVAQGAGRGDAEAFARAVAEVREDPPEVSTVRPGARLGIDVGSVRIGVAVCDPAGSVATPVETVPRGSRDLARLAELARDYAAVELVVGLPVSMSGEHGKAAGGAREFATRLATTVPLPVRMVDERLSTVGATRQLRDSGLPGRRQRAVIDQAAAVIILQNALDAERSTGIPPGVSIAPNQGEA